jgi:hypothetical protein
MTGCTVVAGPNTFTANTPRPGVSTRNLPTWLTTP